MNQGRIWCVVNPTVGLPLFLGSVATIAIVVHASVLTHTTWFSNYWQGGAKAKAAATTTAPAANAGTSGAFAVSVAPATGADGATSFVVTVKPNGTISANESEASRPSAVALAPAAK